MEYEHPANSTGRMMNGLPDIGAHEYALITSSHLIPDTGDKEFSIYPNPATNQVTIDYCPYPSSENHLVIYNINGVELLNQHFKKGETLIDISAFPAGIYFMKLVVDNITALKKIIKQ